MLFRGEDSANSNVDKWLCSKFTFFLTSIYLLKWLLKIQKASGINTSNLKMFFRNPSIYKHIKILAFFVAIYSYIASKKSKKRVEWLFHFRRNSCFCEKNRMFYLKLKISGQNLILGISDPWKATQKWEEKISNSE